MPTLPYIGKSRARHELALKALETMLRPPIVPQKREYFFGGQLSPSADYRVQMEELRNTDWQDELLIKLAAKGALKNDGPPKNRNTLWTVVNRYFIITLAAEAKNGSTRLGDLLELEAPPPAMVPPSSPPIAPSPPKSKLDRAPLTSNPFRVLATNQGQPDDAGKGEEATAEEEERNRRVAAAHKAAATRRANREADPTGEKTREKLLQNAAGDPPMDEYEAEPEERTEEILVTGDGGLAGNTVDEERSVAKKIDRLTQLAADSLEVMQAIVKNIVFVRDEVVKTNKRVKALSEAAVGIQAPSEENESEVIDSIAALNESVNSLASGVHAAMERAANGGVAPINLQLNMTQIAGLLGRLSGDVGALRDLTLDAISTKE